MDKRFISEVHPPVPVVLIYASESGSQGFGVPVMTIGPLVMTSFESASTCVESTPSFGTHSTRTGIATVIPCPLELVLYVRPDMTQVETERVWRSRFRRQYTNDIPLRADFAYRVSDRNPETAVDPARYEFASRMNSVKTHLLSKVQQGFTDVYSKKQRHPDDLMTCLEQTAKEVFESEKANPDNTFMRDVISINPYQGGRTGGRPDWPVGSLDLDTDPRGLDMWIDFPHAVEGDEPE